MVYKAIGLLSGPLHGEGLQIVYVQLLETAGKWAAELLASAREPYPAEWAEKLGQAAFLPAQAYAQVDWEFGDYAGSRVNAFIEAFGLQHQVHLVAFQGYPGVYFPGTKITLPIGHGATIAARTALPVVTDLQALDQALGGSGTMPAAALLPDGASSIPEPWYAAVSTALSGVLRWREENNMLHPLTGASRSSIGGALWLGGAA